MRHRDGVRRNAPCIRSSLMPCSGLPCLRATLTISTMTYRFDSGLPSAKSAAAKTAALLRSFHDGLAYDFECSIPELETKLRTEERRVGKEGVSTFRSGWSPAH